MEMRVEMVSHGILVRSSHMSQRKQVRSNTVSPTDAEQSGKKGVKLGPADTLIPPSISTLAVFTVSQSKAQDFKHLPCQHWGLWSRKSHTAGNKATDNCPTAPGEPWSHIEECEEPFSQAAATN